MIHLEDNKIPVLIEIYQLTQVFSHLTFIRMNVRSLSLVVILEDSSCQ